MKYDLEADQVMFYAKDPKAMAQSLEGVR